MPLWPVLIIISIVNTFIPTYTKTSDLLKCLMLVWTISVDIFINFYFARVLLFDPHVMLNETFPTSLKYFAWKNISNPENAENMHCVLLHNAKFLCEIAEESYFRAKSIQLSFSLHIKSFHLIEILSLSNNHRDIIYWNFTGM